LLLVALPGCVSVPTPVEVAQSCSRQEAAIRGDTRGSARSYHEKVQARCEDDSRHGTVAVVEKDATENRRSGSIQYEERDGDERTEVSVVGSTDGKSTQQEVKKKRENKYLIWGWSWGVKVKNPR